MITTGLDLSSQATNTAACVIDWSEHRASITHLILGVDDDTIVRLIVNSDKFGIDVPLGWPIAFATAIAQHSRDGSWPDSYSHADTASYRLRRTDIAVWKGLGTSPPLSVSSDRIALPAMRAASLLSRLQNQVALDGSGTVVEVYPAAALRRWGLPSRRYKRRENANARRELVNQFRAETGDWLHLGDAEVSLCNESDDAFDSLIAALVARAAAVALVEPIPEADHDVAVHEGWIAVPLEGSLGRLADDAGS